MLGHPAKGRCDLVDLVELPTQSLSAVTAACLLVDKMKYLQVGGMDEDNFEVAFNDVDLCLKLDAAGYRNIYTPHATLTHLESISRGLDTSPEKTARYTAQATFMQAKWGDKVRQDRFYNVNLTAEREDLRCVTEKRISPDGRGGLYMPAVPHLKPLAPFQRAARMTAQRP